jgi:hypothetical protein
MSSLLRLAALVRGEGGMLAALVRDEAVVRTEGSDADGPAQVAAAGPRAAGRREQYELLLEAIYEGYLLHYSEPRVIDGSKADLRLLAGDRLYALGLSRLVGLGDVAAVAELSDLITISARAQEVNDPELAIAAWMAGARAIGWGPSAEHGRAKELAFAGAPEALEALRTSAERSLATRP